MAVEYLHIDVLRDDMISFGAKSIRTVRLERHSIKTTAIPRRTETVVRQLPEKHNAKSGLHVQIGKPFSDPLMHDKITAESDEACVRDY